MIFFLDRCGHSSSGNQMHLQPFTDFQPGVPAIMKWFRDCIEMHNIFVKSSALLQIFYIDRYVIKNGFLRKCFLKTKRECNYQNKSNCLFHNDDLSVNVFLQFML